MCFDAYFILQIYRSGFKIGFYDAETFFDFPSSLTYFQDIFYIIVQQICCYCIQSIIKCFVFNLICIQIVFNLRNLTIFSNSGLSDKSGWIVWISSFFFYLPGFEHFFSTLHLGITYRFLIFGIFRRVCDDKTLVQGMRSIRLIFII